MSPSWHCRLSRWRAALVFAWYQWRCPHAWVLQHNPERGEYNRSWYWECEHCHAEQPAFQSRW